MLSVLIPVYNIDCFPLVNNLVNQLGNLNIDYEIICLDDASKRTFGVKDKLKNLPYVIYEVLASNMGRSKIRNLLASKAKHEWLLFLDADTIPVNNNYISTYIDIIKSHPKQQVFFGGIAYQDDAYSKENSLRYKYGITRESVTFKERKKNPYSRLLMSNSLVQKIVFDKVSFNENIILYGHEDTVFSYDLYGASIRIKHINNPLYHTGLETNKAFIKKSKIAIKNLWYLYLKGLIHPEINRMLRYYIRIKKVYLVNFFAFIYKKYSKSFEKALSKENPSLFIYDLYRLSYLCYLARLEK